MRVATVDIGTNTVLLLVAERDEGGRVRAVLERAQITRLGEGVDRTRRLAPAAIQRTLACLGAYAEDVRRSGVSRVDVVGTSAMRDAPEGDSVRTFVRETFGVEARVLSGEEEARMAFRGALQGLRADPRETAAVFDIGGGSTEIIVGRLKPSGLEADFLRSFDVGSVRLTERLVRHDPPTREELDGIARALSLAFADVPALPAGLTPVGVAGTMTTLAAVALQMSPYDGALVHGYVLPTPALSELVTRLASLSVDDRKRLPGMEPNRADVIVAGGSIAVALLRHWSAPEVVVSDGGVRWGLADELLASA